MFLFFLLTNNCVVTTNIITSKQLRQQRSTVNTILNLRTCPSNPLLEFYQGTWISLYIYYPKIKTTKQGS